MLSVGASPKDELLAFFHAFALDRAHRAAESEIDIAACYEQNKMAANAWVLALQRGGFKTSTGVLGSGRVRCSWASDSKDE